MYNKIIIVEDLDVIGLGIQNRLHKINDNLEIVFSQYCDDAYLKIVTAKKSNSPFDLLITDLSFEQDYRTNKISSGSELISKLRSLDYKIPIIAFSVEDKSSVIASLLKNYKVNAYVLKDRDGLNNLELALKAVHNGETYLSPKIANSFSKEQYTTLGNYDIMLLKLLAEGLSQVEISENLSKQNKVPSSLSTIEKHLGDLKYALKAKNVTQLVAQAKDLGLI